jgi:hypothetical protein
MSGLKNGRSGEYPAATMTALMPWLTPAPGPARDQLAATIGRLAAEHDAPRFQPHVTVLVTYG